MITISKKDLDNVLHRIVMPAHYNIVFKELSEVYDYNIDFTWSDFIKPFVNKKFTYQVPCTGVNMNRDVRYVDYLTPLFYTAYFCRNETSDRIIKEVLGYVLKEFGHFQYPESCRAEWEEFHFDDLEFGDFHQYWGIEYPKLTEEELDKIKNIEDKFNLWKTYMDKTQQ